MHKKAKTTKGTLHFGHEFQLYNRVQRNRMVTIRGTCVTVPIYERNSALNMRRNIIRRKGHPPYKRIVKSYFISKMF